MGGCGTLGMPDADRAMLREGPLRQADEQLVLTVWMLPYPGCFVNPDDILLPPPLTGSGLLSMIFLKSASQIGI